MQQTPRPARWLVGAGPQQKARPHMFQNNSPMNTQPTDTGYQYSQATQYQGTQSYDYANYPLQSVNQQPKKREGNNAAIVLVALAILVAAIVAFLIFDPLNLLGNKGAEKEAPAIEKTAAADDNDPAIVEEPTGAAALSITISSIDSEQFPNVDIYALITSPAGDLASALTTSSLTVTENANGNDHTCTITGIEPTSSSGSYKVSYTSSLPTKDGSQRTVKLAAAEGSGYEGWGTKAYTAPVEQTTQPEQTQQNDSAQNNGGTTNITINMPDGTQTTTTPTTTTTTRTTTSSSYILPESSTRVYSYAELQQLTKSELELARNEIFARHGRRFSTDYLQEYFDSQSWYVPMYSPEYFDTYVNDLNSIEKQNIERIQSLE